MHEKDAEKSSHSLRYLLGDFGDAVFSSVDFDRKLDDSRYPVDHHHKIDTLGIALHTFTDRMDRRIVASQVPNQAYWIDECGGSGRELPEFCGLLSADRRLVLKMKGAAFAAPFSYFFCNWTK